MQKKQLDYLECDKSGYHYGQVLNMICLEQTCLDKALCCSACIQQFHKNHATKPLKLVLSEAREQAQKIQPMSINTDKVIDLLHGGRNVFLEKIGIFRQKLMEHVDTIEKTLVGFYASTVQQVKIKTTNSKDGIDQLFDQVYNDKTIPYLLTSMQKIISLIPKKDAAEETIKQNELMETISSYNLELTNYVAKLFDDVLAKVKQASTGVGNIIAQKDIWAKQVYKFSSKFKHPELQLINPTLVKSGSTQTYKFALLEPQIKKTSGVQKLAFRIKQISNNWLAVGVCHKNVVEGRNYSFAFNSIGHGGYLISSNGGSWSHIKSEFNNAVKTFKFGKSDIILLEVNYDTERIKFRKKGQNDSYELEFAKINGDPLYACILLYYPNDQIEFLPEYKQ